MTLWDSVLLRGPWLSVAVVQMTLVALLGWLGWLLARRGGPALRTAVLLAALVGLILTPAVATVAPVWLALPAWACLPDAELPPSPVDRVPAAPPSRARPSPDDPAVVALLVPPPPPKELGDPAELGKQNGEVAVPVNAEAVVFNFDPPGEDLAPPARPSAPPASWSPAGLLGTLWLFGIMACLARALVRLALLYRRSWQARPIRGRAWTDRAESLGQQHGLPRAALRTSRAIALPLTLGLFRPVILLPRGWRQWSAEQRDLILLHELAHVWRRDFLAGLLAELAVCLYWFHPLVRWLAARLRLEQEYAADAWVASAAGDPTDYVRCLARLALELDRGHGLLAPAFWRRRPEILRRIDMLRRNHRGLPIRLGAGSGWTVAAFTAIACLVVGGVGSLRSAADASKTSEEVPDATTRATIDRHGDPLPAGALTRFGTTRMRHGAEVTFVAFGPEGKTLLTACRDNTIRLWSLADGKELRRFAPPKPAAKPPEEKAKKDEKAPVELMKLMAGGGGENSRIALTADSKTIAVSRSAVIQLYNVETGDELRQIQGQGNGFIGLLFSPDGKTLAGRTGDGTLHLWATDTGKEIRQLAPPPRPRNDGVVLILGGGGDANAPGMTFTPDSKILAAATTEYVKDAEIQSVVFWDVATGKETQRIKAGGNVGAVAVAPDGQVVAYGIGNTLHLCEVKTGKELRQIKPSGGRIVALAFTPDGKALVIRGRNQRLGLWDTQSGNERRLLSDAQVVQRTGGGFVLMTPGVSAPETRALAISADGKQVASAAGSTIRLWDISTGKEVPLSDGHWTAPTSVALSRDGKTMVSWGGDRVIRRWDTTTGRLLGMFPAPPRSTQAALSRDGQTIALANADNTIRLHDTTTGKELRRFPAGPSGAGALAFTADGKMLASRDNEGNTIHFFDVTNGSEVRHVTLRQEREPGQGIVLMLGGSGSRSAGPGLAFSPDGKLLVAPGPGGGDSGNTLVLIDPAAGKALRKIELPQAVLSLAFSPDGRTLATENADRTITLWETASGKQRAHLGKIAATPPRPAGGGRNVSFVIDGMGGGFPEPAGPVGLAFSPDGRALAVPGSDRSVHVWDVTAGKEIGLLKGHDGRIDTVTFAPDGKTLASGATDTTILLWDAAGPMKELAKAQAVELPTAEMETIWNDLAGEDAARALTSALRMAADARQAAPFLRDRLKPAVRVDPRKVDGWIGELESEKYAVRKAAAANLVQVGEQAVPALRKVLAASPTLEMRKRIEELLEKLTGGTLSTAQLRLVRAVEVLERIGTPEARDVLRTLARGAPGALPTQEAEAALARGR
jgi:WD40 repeat protein/beta-lactamase regulating signal transducer with metallopeptidase domain